MYCNLAPNQGTGSEPRPRNHPSRTEYNVNSLVTVYDASLPTYIDWLPG